MIFSCNIPYFCRKLGKVEPNLSSSAVVIGALRVKKNDDDDDNTLICKCICIFTHIIYQKKHLKLMWLHNNTQEKFCIHNTKI